MPTATCITRFAPSPTGQLHLGHAYAAKVAHDMAREQGGRFLLRFEDIDTTRVRPHFYDHILEDLQWLELPWDGTPLRQTDRLAAYAEALETLKQLGVVYPCFCTRKQIEHELQQITNAPHGPEGALYPGTCRQLSAQQIEQRLSQGQLPSWRFHAERAQQLCGPLTLNDQRHGKLEVQPLLLGDVILARKDIGTSYHIAVVVDDAYQGVTHVTRGEDLLHSTHIHRLLQHLLGYPEPSYLHHALVCDDSGKRLAKRHDSLSIKAMRDSGCDLASLWAQCRLLP